MRIQLVPLLLLALSARPAVAQTEAGLRAYFEGKSIKVNMEMPGSDDGVDVYPVKSQPIDFRQHAARLKQFGTSIKRGDHVLITKVKLKDDLIEFLDKTALVRAGCAGPARRFRCPCRR